jgi:hypothetical protein
VSEMMSALIVAGVSILGQLLIGYWWKRGVEAKDEKISKLEERVDEMDVRRLTKIEGDIDAGARSRKSIYERMDRIEISAAKASSDLAHAMSHLPKIEEVTKELAATAATLQRVADQVDSIVARQFGDAQIIGTLKGRGQG